MIKAFTCVFRDENKLIEGWQCHLRSSIYFREPFFSEFYQVQSLLHKRGTEGVRIGPLEAQFFYGLSPIDLLVSSYRAWAEVGASQTCFGLCPQSAKWFTQSRWRWHVNFIQICDEEGLGKSLNPIPKVMNISAIEILEGYTFMYWYDHSLFLEARSRFRMNRIIPWTRIEELTPPIVNIL